MEHLLFSAMRFVVAMVLAYGMRRLLMPREIANRPNFDKSSFLVYYYVMGTIM